MKIFPIGSKVRVKTLEQLEVMERFRYIRTGDILFEVNGFNFNYSMLKYLGGVYEVEDKYLGFSIAKYHLKGVCDRDGFKWNWVNFYLRDYIPYIWEEQKEEKKCI